MTVLAVERFELLDRSRYLCWYIYCLAIDLATGWRMPKTYELLVREIKYNIKQLEQQSYTIHFFVGPAHVGIAGNELA